MSEMTVKELTSDINILRRIVSSRFELNEADYTKCPFHSENNPSLHLYMARDKEKALFYCHGCGATGDVIDFVRRLDSLNFNEATTRICRAIGQESIPALIHLPSLGPRQGQGQIASDEEMQKYCQTKCLVHDELIEDYYTIMMENKRLREKLGLPEFAPGEPKETTNSPLIRIRVIGTSGRVIGSYQHDSRGDVFHWTDRVSDYLAPYEKVLNLNELPDEAASSLLSWQPVEDSK